MIEKIKNLLSQLVQEDYDVLEDKRASKKEMSPEAKKIDMILSKLDDMQIKEIFNSLPEENAWESEQEIE